MHPMFHMTKLASQGESSYTSTSTLSFPLSRCDEVVTVPPAVTSLVRTVCRSLDAALVSPGEPIPFPVTRTKPDLSKGMAYNLANNIWGTNYIMWQPYEPEQSRMRFRFLLQMTKADQSDQHRQHKASE